MRWTAVAAVVVAATLVAGFFVHVVRSGGMLFHVGVDNREADWVKVDSVRGADVLVLADGRAYRVRRRVTEREPAFEDLFAWDVSLGHVYVDIEPSETADTSVRVDVHRAWARCGNAFMSPNPFDEVPEYQRYARFDGERVTSE